MWLIRKFAVGFDNPAVISAGLSCSLVLHWQQQMQAAALPSPLSALWLGLESQRVKNSLRNVCRSSPASSFPCQGSQPHAFVITGKKEQIPSKPWCLCLGPTGATLLEETQPCSRKGLLREQHPCKTCHGLTDIFGDSFHLGRCLQKQERDKGCWFHFASYLSPRGYF